MVIDRDHKGEPIEDGMFCEGRLHGDANTHFGWCSFTKLKEFDVYMVLFLTPRQLSTNRAATRSTVPWSGLVCSVCPG